MADVDLILFDDAVARDWYPFTLTRPAGELLLGTMTLRERAERVLGCRCRACVAPELVGFAEPDAPPVIQSNRLNARTTTVFLSSRCVLHWDVVVDTTRESTLFIGDQVAGWVVPAGGPAPSEDQLMLPSETRGEKQSLGGRMIDNAWDMIGFNHDHVASDILHLHKGAVSARPAHVHLLGDYPLICGEGVVIEPNVVFDLSAGPVWLDDGVFVRAMSRIAGPMYVGRNSSLLGGVFTGSSIGPVCKVHGELEESIILGYTNKAHEGFLGHSYLGMWVNLGAMTTTSDLKNNYGTVRVATGAGEVDTGLTKLGALIGDHVKSAIGTLFMTGTVIGTGANVFDVRPPRHILPFSWGTESRYDEEKFLASVARVMGRRDVELTAAHRDMLSRVWQSTRSE